VLSLNYLKIGGVVKSRIQWASMRHVAIVGGSGFIGLSLANYLSSSYEVGILDTVPPRDFKGRFLACDIRDRKSLAESLHGFELVINTAIIQIPAINNKKRLGYEVNVLGLQNLCEVVESSESLRGLLHVGSWHVFGEREFSGTIDEEFGFRPDKVDERARVYALCKITQEAIIRIVQANSNKYYGIIRVGTVLGEGMPKQTAANIFIESALHKQPLTPFRHMQYRPMLYVDIQDVCSAFGTLSSKVLTDDFAKDRITTPAINLMWPKPVTIIGLAHIVREKVTRLTHGKIKPKIEVIDRNIKPFYSVRDKDRFRADVSLARKLLKVQLTHPEKTIERIISARLVRGSDAGRI
jgi:nucleoside-diphosphate-sugar epimerase